MPSDPSAEAVALARKIAPCVCVIHGRTPGETYDHARGSLVPCRDCNGTGADHASSLEAIDEALARARAEGRREGIGASWKAVRNCAALCGSSLTTGEMNVWDACLDEVRALAKEPR